MIINDDNHDKNDDNDNDNDNNDNSVLSPSITEAGKDYGVHQEQAE